MICCTGRTHTHTYIKAPTHKRNPYARDKRKGQRCLSRLTSNKHHTFSSQGRPEVSIQRKRRGRNEWRTEWESGRKQAFPRITPTLPGPAQFTTTKQPPCSHRGTSGQPLNSPWDQQRALLGWKDEQVVVFFKFHFAWRLMHEHSYASRHTASIHTHTHTGASNYCFIVKHLACNVSNV